MKNRYDGVPGKEASNAKARHNRLEAEHSANNSFVKKVQSEQAKYAGRAPNLMSEAMHLNAYQTNTGERAQDLAKEITRGLDPVAFPVK